MNALQLFLISFQFRPIIGIWISVKRNDGLHTRVDPLVMVHPSRRRSYIYIYKGLLLLFYQASTSPVDSLRRRA